MASGRTRAKFRVGQVVMRRTDEFDSYPVKLRNRTRIGRSEERNAWMDTLGQVVYERELRPLTKREAYR